MYTDLKIQFWALFILTNVTDGWVSVLWSVLAALSFIPLAIDVINKNKIKEKAGNKMKITVDVTPTEVHSLASLFATFTQQVRHFSQLQNLHAESDLKKAKKDLRKEKTVTTSQEDLEKEAEKLATELLELLLG